MILSSLLYMVSITGIVIWSVGWSIGWSVGLWWYPKTRKVSLLLSLRSHFFHIEPRLLATAQSIDETKIHFVASALTCFKSNTAPLWINQGVPLTLSYPNYMLINVHSLHYYSHKPQALHGQRNTWRTLLNCLISTYYLTILTNSMQSYVFC